MCLALVALDAHPRYALLIAANRDEFHARVAEPAHWWSESILGGRDGVGGGTWFGVTTTGRWALVTNYREGVPRDPSAPSRGAVVTAALHDRRPPLICAAATAVDSGRYHGFNLLLGEASEIAYTSNRASGAVALGAGIHGLSNHLLETPWPKLLRAKKRLAAVLAGDADPVAGAFDLLADRERAAASTLPSTGVSPEWERLLSSAFIVHPEYGTRCSTVLAVDRRERARLVERSFDAQGECKGEVVFDFELSPAR